MGSSLIEETEQRRDIDSNVGPELRQKSWNQDKEENMSQDLEDKIKV